MKHVEMASRLGFVMMMMTGACLLPCTALATAPQVLLVHPPDADAFVDEVYHRLDGELRAHALAVRAIEGEARESSDVGPEDLLRRTEAVACILVEWRRETSIVRVWIARPLNAPSLFEAAALERRPDVPTMLAARAVDLLVSAMNVPSSMDANRVPAPSIPHNTAAETVSPRKETLPVGGGAKDTPAWDIELGGAAAFDGAAAGFAAGPELAVHRLVWRRLSLGARIAAPLVGAHTMSAEGSSRLMQGLGIVELSSLLARSGPFSGHLVGGMGTYFLRAQGTVADGIASVRSSSDARWVMAAEAGVLGTLAMSSRVALTVRVGALFLLPRPRVVVGRDSANLAEPLLLLGAGVRVSL